MTMASENDVRGNATALRHYITAMLSKADAKPEEREQAKAVADVALRLLEYALIDLNRIASALEAIVKKK
jgi:hypothetical protein